jgi:hypothetical protein
MKNLCLRFFFKIITSSLLMLVIIARFKAEQICRKIHFKIVSSGESLFSVIKHKKTLSYIVIRNCLEPLNILFILF